MCSCQSAITYIDGDKGELLYRGYPIEQLATNCDYMREAAAVIKKIGQKVAKNVKLALVVPGSGLVKEQAEREGLDKIFVAAGFEWREPGCSMLRILLNA